MQEFVERRMQEFVERRMQEFVSVQRRLYYIYINDDCHELIILNIRLLGAGGYCLIN